jgi:hypothetical protein
MGVMICEKHGRAHFVETCLHIAKDIDEGRVPSGHRFNVLGDYFLCDRCFSLLGFERLSAMFDLAHDEVVEMDEELWKRFYAAYDAIEGRRLICVKCLAELEERNL